MSSNTHFYNARQQRHNEREKIIYHNDYNGLCKLSSLIGSDPWQVQGAGGNTSIKTDGLMWIKASGTWLANANTSELFVPVELDPLLDALKADDQRAEKSTDFVRESLNPHSLRPSIETSVHAVLPQKVVVHIHCVDTIALAVQTQAEQLFEKVLKDFQWLWVPYHRPGLPLSRYISAHLEADTNVVVLGNHGLVVAADSVQEAADLLERVRAAVKQPDRSYPAFKSDALTALCNNTQYRPSNCVDTHAVAMDDIALTVAAGGSMYPDHVIFLGSGTQVVSPYVSIAEIVSQLESEPSSIVVPGSGVIMHKDANASQHAMARCLSDVCLRIDSQASVRYLNDDEEYQLLNWEAESYRQSIAT